MEYDCAAGRLTSGRLTEIVERIAEIEPSPQCTRG
jgi:hypothetical protein